MGGNGKPSALNDSRANFLCGLSEHVWQGGANAEQMALGRGYFNAGNDQKSIHGQAVIPQQSLPSQVIVGFTGIVIGDGNAAEPALAGRFNQAFGGMNPILGKEGMRMDVESMQHGKSSVEA